MSEVTYVYCAYGRDDIPLYVGITKDARRRINEHRKYSRWYPMAKRFDVSSYPSREVALSMEAQRHMELLPLMGWCDRGQYHADHHNHEPIESWTHEIVVHGWND